MKRYMAIAVVHYGAGGELDRRVLDSEDEIEEALCDMGPWAVGDTIKIVETKAISGSE